MGRQDGSRRNATTPRHLPRNKPEFFFDFRAREPALPDRRKEIERDRSQQDFGVPECESSLQNCV